MTIERDRPAGLPSQKDALEQHLLHDLRAVGLPEPLRELHFCWCCECSRAQHVRDGADEYCTGCAVYQIGRLDLHAYKRDRNWRFDLAWPAKMLAVEVDGGTFTGGRHTRGQGYEADTEKLNEAVLRGWRVLRVTKHQVEDGSAVAWVERAFGGAS